MFDVFRSATSLHSIESIGAWRCRSKTLRARMRDEMRCRARRSGAAACPRLRNCKCGRDEAENFIDRIGRRRRFVLVEFTPLRPVEFHSNPKCFFTATQWFFGLIRATTAWWMGKRNGAGVECESESKPSADCRAAVVALAAARAAGEDCTACRRAVALSDADHGRSVHRRPHNHPMRTVCRQSVIGEMNVLPPACRARPFATLH